MSSERLPRGAADAAPEAAGVGAGSGDERRRGARSPARGRVRPRTPGARGRARRLLVGLAAAAIVAAAGGSAAVEPRPYGSLSRDEQALCDQYAIQAERIARGREAGFSVYSPLQALREACAEHPADEKVCKGFPPLARTIHREKWRSAEAGAKVRSDCLRWIYP